MKETTGNIIKTATAFGASILGLLALKASIEKIDDCVRGIVDITERMVDEHLEGGEK